MLRKSYRLCLLMLLLFSLMLVPGIVLAQTVSPQDLEQAGKDSIIAKLGNSDDYEITANYVPDEDIPVPDGEISLKGELPYGVHLSGPTVVNVVISANDTAYKGIKLRFTVRKFANVLLAARDITAHELLDKACVRVERRDVGRLTPGYLTDVSQIEGLTVQRLVREGTVLTKWIVTKPILVKRGNIITLVAKSKNMEVTATGQALEDGAAGQMIRIKNLNSQKIVVAQVIDAVSAQAVTYNGR